jgi:hypothetical protein
VAGADPKPTLNKIKIISLSSIFDGEVKGKCRIDLQAWDTALQFIANQSTRLKIITYDELLTEIRSKRLGTDEEARRYASMPQLQLILTIIEMQSGCASVLDARLIGAVESTRLIATDQFVYSPSVELWSSNRWFRSTHADFAQFAINTGETVLKQFVNDWAKSQR